MLKTVLVDDEELSLEQLIYILNYQQDVEISGAFTDPVEALKNIKIIHPDILIVDVSMPCINGFQLAKEVRNEGLQPFIIFATAYREYAINAFEVEAIDYIQKPFMENRLNDALDKIRRRLQHHYHANKKTESHNLHHDPLSTHNLNWFPVEENESIILIHVDDVYYGTVDGKTTVIHTRKGVYPIAYTLSRIEENYRSKLFFRCHKSFVVNLNHVEKIIPLFKQNHILKLREQDTEIPVSRHYVKKLKRFLNLEAPK